MALVICEQEIKFHVFWENGSIETIYTYLLHKGNEENGEDDLQREEGRIFPKEKLAIWASLHDYSVLWNWKTGCDHEFGEGLFDTVSDLSLKS